MKIGHVLGLVVVGYLAIVGINEFLRRHATPRVVLLKQVSIGLRQGDWRP